MTKYLKGIRDINNPQIVECPYCGKITFISTESSFTQKGYRRLRYRRITNCPECEGRFRLED